MKALLVSAATLGLLAATPAFATAGPTASDSASATADIVAPITITKTQDMSFGHLVSPSSNTAVVLASDGTLSGSLAVPGGSTGSAATFDVTGAEYNYSIVSPTATIALTNGTPADDMTLTLNYEGGTSARAGLAGDGTDQIVVDGSLAVAGGQAAGHYTGSFTVTVAYD